MVGPPRSTTVKRCTPAFHGVGEGFLQDPEETQADFLRQASGTASWMNSISPPAAGRNSSRQKAAAAVTPSISLTIHSRCEMA